MDISNRLTGFFLTLAMLIIIAQIVFAILYLTDKITWPLWVVMLPTTIPITAGILLLLYAGIDLMINGGE